MTSSTVSDSSSSSAQPIPEDLSVRIVMREALARGREDFWTATSYFQDDSRIRFTMPSDAVALPGILLVEVALFQGDRLILVNHFQAVVERSLMSADYHLRGCPTVAELRTHIRDTAPEDNYLLANLEYELGEISAAMIRTVDLWNTLQPPIPQRYTTTTFPWPTGLLPGVIGHLYLIAASNYRRNHLSYQAAGVSVDDKNKAQEYEQQGQQLVAEYKRWLQAKKVQINAEAWSGVQSSPYRRAGGGGHY